MEDFIYTMKQRSYLTPLESGTLTGLLLAGCFVGALIGGQTCEIISRKRTIILASIVFILGAAIQTGTNGYAMMVTGRAIAGLGIGGLSMSIPLYQVTAYHAPIFCMILTFFPIFYSLNLVT